MSGVRAREEEEGEEGGVSICALRGGKEGKRGACTRRKGRRVGCS